MFFNNHRFFLTKGQPISSHINEHISSKVFLDIEDEGNLFNTDDCTIFAYVKFINEFEIESKTKTFEFSRRFTIDWKLTKFKHIIEQINQSRPSSKISFLYVNKFFYCILVGNQHRLVSDRFQFTHK